MRTICKSNELLKSRQQAPPVTDLEDEAAAQPDARPWYSVHGYLLRVLAASLGVLVVEALAMRFI